MDRIINIHNPYELTRFVCNFTMELDKRVRYELRNGWGKKIKESVKNSIEQLAPKPDIGCRVNILKQVWEQKGYINPAQQQKAI